MSMSKTVTESTLDDVCNQILEDYIYNVNDYSNTNRTAIVTMLHV